MEQLDFITNILGIRDKNIIFLDYLDAGTHKEIIAKLDYPAPMCLDCQGQMAKFDFQKEFKIPYLECAVYKTFIRLRKRRFRCKVYGKMAVAETSLVQKEPPNFNDRQPENHSKINRESLYDCYHRNFIVLYFDSHP